MPNILEVLGVKKEEPSYGGAEATASQSVAKRFYGQVMGKLVGTGETAPSYQEFESAQNPNYYNAILQRAYTHGDWGGLYRVIGDMSKSFWQTAQAKATPSEPVTQQTEQVAKDQQQTAEVERLKQEPQASKTVSSMQAQATARTSVRGIPSEKPTGVEAQGVETQAPGLLAEAGPGAGIQRLLGALPIFQALTGARQERGIMAPPVFTTAPNMGKTATQDNTLSDMLAAKGMLAKRPITKYTVPTVGKSLSQLV